MTHRACVKGTHKASRAPTSRLSQKSNVGYGNLVGLQTCRGFQLPTTRAGTLTRCAHQMPSWPRNALRRRSSPLLIQPQSYSTSTCMATARLATTTPRSRLRHFEFLELQSIHLGRSGPRTRCRQACGKISRHNKATRAHRRCVFFSLVSVVFPALIFPKSCISPCFVCLAIFVQTLMWHLQSTMMMQYTFLHSSNPLLVAMSIVGATNRATLVSLTPRTKDGTKPRISYQIAAEIRQLPRWVTGKGAATLRRTWL